jgi:two-component system, NarL family, sensor histidine kinase UhpB
MSLRVRLNLIITTLIALFTLVTGKIIVDDMRNSIREEIEAGTRVSLQLLTAVLYESDLARQRTGREHVLLPFLEKLGRVRAHEIRLYDSRGTLIYRSPPPIYKAGRSAPDWFTRMVEPRQVEQALDTAEGRIVIAPDASRAILDSWDDLRGLGWLLLGFLLAVNLAVFFLLGRSLRPVRTILSGLSQMERGRYDVRLPVFTLPEFDSIGQTFNRMANALGESHAENLRLALVTKQSSDAIIIHDLKGNISFWNPAAERLLGYRAEAIVGRSARLLTPSGLEAELTDNLATIRAGGLIENLETRRVAQDGRVVDVALSAAPLVDPASNEVIGEICSMRDITEHKRVQQAEAELEQNRRFTQLIQTRLEEERRAIARELHDEMGQSVTAIRTIGAAIANRTESSDAQIHGNARAIVQVAGHLYDVVHGIIRQLRPSALDHLGLRDALEGWVETWRSRYPDISLDLRLEGELSDLGETVNITVYRIVQECLTNVVRHSGASRAQISIRRTDDALEVMVQDNGRGLGERDADEAARFGLMGMRERVQALRGEFELAAQPVVGLTVRARIPLTRVAQPQPAATH